ncbi:MAG: hypothetical protein IJA39_01630, partial [Clostridia bacterium]|nr:hypothetical protein [Clostridia bacterium]
GVVPYRFSIRLPYIIKGEALPKHFPKGKYITHSEGMNITSRKGNITHSEAMNITARKGNITHSEAMNITPKDGTCEAHRA